MTVIVRFDGGPLHNLRARVSSLPQCQIFFDSRNQSVFCYNRVDELVYEFEPSVSRALTERYNETLEKFGIDGSSVSSWNIETEGDQKLDKPKGP